MINKISIKTFVNFDREGTATKRTNMNAKENKNEQTNKRISIEKFIESIIFYGKNENTKSKKKIFGVNSIFVMFLFLIGTELDVDKTVTKTKREKQKILKFMNETL